MNGCCRSGVALPFVAGFCAVLLAAALLAGARGAELKWRWRPPQNLGPVVNSPFFDAPTGLSADGNTLYFTSSNVGGIGSLDLWATTRKGGRWRPPVNLWQLNAAAEETSATVTADGRLIYFVSDRPDGVGARDVWYAERTEDGWGEPVNLGEEVNSQMYENHAAISPDGQALFFVRSTSNLRGGDLYVSRKTDDGWTTAERLGPAVNSAHEEDHPHVAPRFGLLLFVSNRPGGSGGDDVWAAQRTQAGWQPAVPLPTPPNTKADEAHPVLAPDGRRLFFASKSLAGHGDSDIWVCTRR